MTWENCSENLLQFIIFPSFFLFRRKKKTRWWCSKSIRSVTFLEKSLLVMILDGEAKVIASFKDKERFGHRVKDTMNWCLDCFFFFLISSSSWKYLCFQEEWCSQSVGHQSLPLSLRLVSTTKTDSSYWRPEWREGALFVTCFFPLMSLLLFSVHLLLFHRIRQRREKWFSVHLTGQRCQDLSLSSATSFLLSYFLLHLKQEVPETKQTELRREKEREREKRNLNFTLFSCSSSEGPKIAFTWILWLKQPTCLMPDAEKKEKRLERRESVTLRPPHAVQGLTCSKHL